MELTSSTGTNSADTPKIGVQELGMSPAYTKRMALDAYDSVHHGAGCGCIADIGCGRGELSEAVVRFTTRLLMLDFTRPPELPERAEFIPCDLNLPWSVSDDTVDFAFGLECIEHVENPRHFIREMARILKPGGHGFVSTPNNHTWASKLTFLLKGEHRFFQDASYPAHITPLLQCDLRRILGESGLVFLRWFYSNEDVVPVVGWRVRLPGRLFSLSHGMLFAKQQ